MNDNKLTEILNQPQVPDDLAETLHLNFQQQLGEAERCKKASFWHLKYSMAASVFISIILFSYWFSTPDIISAAYADTQKDSTLNNMLSVPLKNWTEFKNIAPPPTEMTIGMSKFCHLNTYKTAHLRVLGEKQGTVDVFMYPGPLPIFFKKKSGMINDRLWRVLSESDDLNVILLYTKDMRETAVEKLILTMFSNRSTAS